jgi:hypothetical protein
MTRINGWQRMWVLASALWAVALLVLGGRFQPNGAQAVPDLNTSLFAWRLWIMPVAAMYGLGFGIAWVRRGFQIEAK